MFKGLNNVIYKLQLIEKSQPLIMKMFFQRATDWIIDEANFKLESSLYWDKNTFGSNMYERSEIGWKVEILNDNAILTNEFSKTQIKRIVFETKNFTEFLLSKYKKQLDKSYE